MGKISQTEIYPMQAKDLSGRGRRWSRLSPRQLL